MYKQLEQFMFTNDNLIKYNDYLIKTRNDQVNKKNQNQEYNQNLRNNQNNKNNNLFTTKTHDKLFWIFYIILYGHDKYNLNVNYEFQTEKDFKINIVDKLREKKSQIKILKYKISDLENELVNENKISLKIFHLLCFLFDKSVLYITNKIYYDFNYGDKYNIVYHNNNNPGLLNNSNNNKLIDDIKLNYLLINPAKPIKGITSYKINELQDIAKKLDIDIINENKKKTKQILYNDIILKIKKLM